MKLATIWPAAAVAAGLLLSACSTITMEPLPEGLTSQPPANWGERSATLKSLTRWELAGKLAVRQPSDSGTAVINHWIQNGEAYDLSLSSAFLGLGQTRLKGVPGFLELTLSDGETYTSSDPESLIEAATGWQLPIDSLVWWVRGLPGPAEDFRLYFDQQSRLAMIRQHGWEIRYDRWQASGNRYPELPARITALKGDKRVRLVITDWQI
ncbi:MULTISPECIES: lipoprotein insertase outer membrane protein LolB [Marinobacter]|uniref:Outer-membrane lipoprotein LolB n=1 Tax=Marinobacter profundi TaxID=2666256 RepID=A0A2G1UKK6_9GAMM|nr:MULTISPECIES: lipoprotein insertase outer membrane protein LolB [Marinobacter]MBD3658213.1 outer membrane lipoprotein LolB [Marinobacter sp.]PHQ14950.1 outer membrane lipoprotein LolB [Marinobacter profundi]